MQYATNSSFSGATTVTTASGTLTGLTPNTTYYFRARALTSQSGYSSSGWSSAYSSKTLQTPMPSNPELTLEPIDCASVKCIYTSVPQANKYVIEYSTSSDFSNKQTLTI